MKYDESKIEAQLEDGGVDLVDAIAYLVGEQLDEEAEETVRELAGKARVAATDFKAVASARAAAQLGPAVERHDDGSVTVTLAEPVVWNAEKKSKHTYESLTLQPPRGVHLLAAQEVEGALAEDFAVIAAQANVHPRLLEQLHWHDVMILRTVSRIQRGKPQGSSSATPR